jgi:hypothetical protein
MTFGIHVVEPCCGCRDCHNRYQIEEQFEHGGAAVFLGRITGGYFLDFPFGVSCGGDVRELSEGMCRDKRCLGGGRGDLDHKRLFPVLF